MQYVVNRTTTESFAVEAATPQDAKEQVEKPDFDRSNQIAFNTSINVQARPQPIKPTSPQSPQATS